MSPHPSRRFGVVVPAKRMVVAKSRLTARLHGLDEGARGDVVAALVLDTVEAALDCDRVGAVLLVTDDLALAGAARDAGAWAIPDGRPGDLNATLVQGAAELVRRDPDLRPVAVCGDLPALRPSDLAHVLDAMSSHPQAFVADRAGMGTTVYAAANVADFEPRFGADSRAAHLRSGAVEVEAPAGVRQDVDVPEDLAAALELGVGRRTSFVALRHGLGRPGAEHAGGAAP